MTTPNDTPAGWYDDGSGRQRWWDGQQWGGFADEASAQPAAEASPTAFAAPATADAPASADAVTTPQAEASAPAGYTPPTYGAPAVGYGAPAYGTPAGYPAAGYAAPVADAGPKKLNILALIAAIIGAVGFICAFIPATLIVAWILLPVAFVISIVSLFLKGDKKWLGIVGLGLSILGGIVSVVVVVVVAATAIQSVIDESGSGDTSVTQPDDSSDADAQGTVENPYPLGSEISNDDWTVVINSVNADGNAVVAEANEINEPAPAGSHYEIVNYTITFTGEESGYAVEVQVAAVTSGGNVVNSFDNLVLLNDSIGIDELYPGGTLTGSAAFVVPDGESIVLRVTPGILADEVFVQP